MTRCLLRFRWLIVVPVAATVLAAVPRNYAAELTPQSPEVKRLIAPALVFIRERRNDDTRIGAKALIALALLKNGAKRNDPIIQDAVKAIQKKLGALDPEKVTFEKLYSPGLAVILLVSLDPSLYEQEIQCLLDFFQSQQKPHGGWGYPERTAGDTSMTQYAVLGAWEAIRAGFKIPPESIDGVTTWLMKTQDPTGVFGYQGQIGPSGKLVAQGGTGLSMGAAGLGSAYICGDLLKLVDTVATRDEDLPPALRKIEERKPDAPREKPRTKVNAAQFQATLGRGNKWMQANYKIDPVGYTHYYMYALERYMSFREITDKGASKKLSAGDGWYADGVHYLAETQDDDGRFDSPPGPLVATAFAVLFLSRSTKQSLEKSHNFGDGTLIGGKGLPKNTDLVAVRGGKVVPRALTGPAEHLLDVLDRPDNEEYDEAIAALGELSPSQAALLTGRYTTRLRELAGGESPQARLAAVRTLAASGNLKNVPTLIYALTDPEPEIAKTARDGLRRISRRPSGFGLADDPAEADRQMVINKWKAWYLAIRPDAEFEN
ncbi:MAG: HEAT repeat domain-containing protein [Candidatus Nealsonbacteria bacterium]|nr:HEAT repeat domain-containing protein [Candidatus Nealsonbacteria bacterium]